MMLAFAVALLLTRLLLWGIFHLAGGWIHLALIAGLALLLLCAVRASRLRA